MAKAKTPPHPDHKPPFIGQRHFNFWMAAVVGVFSVVAGYMLFTATHASSTGEAAIGFSDTNGQNVYGVTLSVSGSPGTSGCYVDEPYPITAWYAGVICSTPPDGNGSFTVTAINSSQQVCSCSPIHVGSVVAVTAGTTTWYTGSKGIVFNAPPPPPPPPSPPPTPTPTPTPHPTPTPSPSSGGTKPSGGSTPAAPSSSGSGSSAATPADSGTVDSSSPPDIGTSVNVSQDQDSSVSSDDGGLTVLFPAGTFDTDAVCQINKLGTTDVPVKSSKLIGPYAVECTGSDGSLLTNLNHSVDIVLRLPSKSASYNAYVKDGKWKTVTAVTKDGELHFSLSALHLIAAAPSAINWTPVLLIGGAILLILIAAGIVVLLGQRRRGQQEAYDAYIKHRYFEGDAGARPPVSQ